VERNDRVEPEVGRGATSEGLRTSDDKASIVSVPDFIGELPWKNTSVKHYRKDFREVDNERQNSKADNYAQAIQAARV